MHTPFEVDMGHPFLNNIKLLCVHIKHTSMDFDDKNVWNFVNKTVSLGVSLPLKVFISIKSESDNIRSLVIKRDFKQPSILQLR